MRLKSSRKLAQMGKRQFIKTLAGFGLSSELVKNISQDKLVEITDNPADPVPRLYKWEHTNHEQVRSGEQPPHRKPVFGTISRDKWIVVEGSHDAARRIQEKIESIPAKIHAQAGVNRNPRGSNESEIVVDFEGGEMTMEELENQLPNQIDGQAGSGGNMELFENIPISIRSVNSESHNFCFDYEYRPVPGGCESQDDLIGNNFTLCSPAYDTDHNEYVMLTAAHNVDFQSNVDVYQPDNIQGFYIGYSDKIEDEPEESCLDYDIDAATIRLVGANHTYDLAGNASGSHYRYPIVGTMGWDWVKDHDDCSESIHHQGRTSCRFETCITQANPNQTYHTEDPGSGGDSGGPHFKLEFNEHQGTVAYLIGLYHCSYTFNGGHTDIGKATYIGKVESELKVII